MPKVVNLNYESSSLTITIWDNDRATVGDLYSEIKRQGHATELLHRVTHYADVLGMTLILAIGYVEKDGLSSAELEKFYEKFDFKCLLDDLDQKSYIMERLPKTQPFVNSQKKHVLI